MNLLQKYHNVVIFATPIILAIFSLAIAEASSSYGDDRGEAQTAYFSIDPLDNWIYEETFQSSGLISFGSVNTITVYPVEQDMSKAIDTYNGVVGQFMRDDSYNTGNAPLERYSNYKMQDYSYAKVLSKENIIIDGQPAIKIIGQSTPQAAANIKFMQIVTTIFDDYYTILYMADPTSFDQRLPEFQEILDTLKFDGIAYYTENKEREKNEDTKNSFDEILKEDKDSDDEEDKDNKDNKDDEDD